MKRTFSIVLALALLPALTQAQDLPALQKLFETGKNKELIAAVAADTSNPSALFLLGQAAEKERDRDTARTAYKKIASAPESDAWHFVGLSAAQLVDADISNERDWRAAHARLREWAETAAKMKPDLFEAQYQLGLAYVSIDYHDDATDAFDRAAKINPTCAYCFYHGGQAQYLAQHYDKATPRFETFLKMAPEAPERTEVQRLMKTAAGR
jgi:tetratricopeptide (TPR) repeat protein